MTTLYLVLGSLAITAMLIYLVVRYSSKASRLEQEAEQTEAALAGRERFDESMREPLARGDDLVRRLRDRVPEHRNITPPRLPRNE